MALQIGKTPAPGAPPSTRLERIQQIAQEPVRVISPDTPSSVMAAIQDGVIVKLTIRRPRFRVTLKPEEFGFSGEIAANLVRTAPVLRLASEEVTGQLDSIDVMLRRALAELSIDTLWGKFLPAAMWSEFKERYDELSERFHENVDAVVEALDNGTVEAWIRTTYTAFAAQVWPLRAPTWVDPTTNLPVGSLHDAAPESFVEAVVNAALGRLPSETEVRAATEMGYSLSILEAPSLELASAMTSNEQLNAELRDQAGRDTQDMVDRFAASTYAAGVAHFRQPLDKLEGKKEDGRVSRKTRDAMIRHYERGMVLNVTSDRRLEIALSDMLDFLARHPSPERWQVTQAIEGGLVTLESELE